MKPGRPGELPASKQQGLNLSTKQLALWIARILAADWEVPANAGDGAQMDWCDQG